MVKILTREGIQRMGRNGGTTVVGGGGSSGGGGGSADYAAEAGHALEADHAIASDNATEAAHATTADSATEAAHATTADVAAEAVHAASSANLDSDSTDWAKIARKDIAQTIAEVWTFAKGIVSTLKSYFNAGIEVTGGVSTDTMTASGNAQASAMIANIFKTLGYTQAVNMIGKGFGVNVDANGMATLQTDHLMVLGRMIVNSLNIREVSYIGGTYLLTPAASQAVKVQPLYTTVSFQPDTRYWTPNGSGGIVGYRLLWLADNGTSGTMNYWKQGDIALCQTFNVTQTGGSTAANQYYKRVVCRVGQVTMTESGITKKYHYADVAAIAGPYLFDSNNQPIYTVDGQQAFDGLMAGSTTPKDGDIVVQCGSQSDTTRQGAVQISSEGEASIGIYDGIKDFRSLDNYEIHYLSKSAVRMNAAYFTWRINGATKTQASVISDLTTAQSDIDGLEEDVTEVVDDVAEISLNVGNIQLGVGKMAVTKYNGITANYDFWEQSGEHTIRNSSWESGYWTNQGNASASSYRIRSAASVYAFSNANGFLIYDMNGGSNLEFFEINNNGTGTPPTFALRYTPPSKFAVPETYTVKAHILSYVKDANDNWVFDQHAQETDANTGVVYITPSKGTVRFRIYFVATGKMIGNDPVDAITNLQPYMATASVSNSLIQMVSDQLKVMVNQCGLNIKQRIVELIADKVNFLMPDGSTNVKISIDPATGTLYAVDGTFEGTVRAKNLFRIVAASCGELPGSYFKNTFVFDEGTTAKIYIGFNDDVTVDDVSFTKGQIVCVDDIDSQVWNDLQALYDDKYYYCIGYADEVNIVSRATSLSSDWYLFIPRAQDVDGKTLTIHHAGNNIVGDIIIRQVDYVAPDGGYAGNNPFYAGMSIANDATTGQGILSMTNATPQLTLGSNTTVILHSFGSYWAVLAEY
jgi:hypothetical protein